MTKGPLLSRFVTRPGTKGVSIYKSSDPPTPALGHFFVPSAVILPDRAFRCAPVLCPLGFSATAGLPDSAVHRPADALAPRHAAGPPLSAPERGRLPPRPASASEAPPPHPPCAGLLPILLLRAVLPGLRGSAAAARLAARPACASSPSPAHQHCRLVLLPLPSTSRLSYPMLVGARLPPDRRRTPALPGFPQILTRSCWCKRINYFHQQFF
jgi:hypothetical protein